MISNANRLRILVALAALKHKPAEQTFSAYVLDLRAVFPCGPSTGGEVYWKEYAVKLEKDYAELKKRFEEREIQSFVSASEGDRTVTSGKPSIPGGPDELSKKKAKKKHAVADRSSAGHRDVILLGAEFEKLCQEEDLSCSGGSGRLFASLETLYRLSACYGQPGFPLELFLSASRRVLDAVSVTFDRNENAGSKLNSNHMQIINTALRILIERSFPIVLASAGGGGGGGNSQGKTDAFASLLNSFLCSVLMPLVRTFHVLSTHHLECLTLSEHEEGSSAPMALLDHRPGLLTLFRSVMSCVDLNLSPSKESSDDMACRLELSLLYHSLVLDTLRHLRDIVRQTVIDTENQKSSKHGRVMRLAIKHTIWYLCSALHIVIGLEIKNASAIVPTTTAVTSSSGSGSAGVIDDAQITRLKLLKGTVLDSFVEFLSRLDKTRRRHAIMRLSALEPDDAAGTDSDVSPNPSAAQDVGEELILLDDMEYRMVMRVVESYSSTT